MLQFLPYLCRALGGGETAVEQSLSPSPLPTCPAFAGSGLWLLQILQGSQGGGVGCVSRAPAPAASPLHFPPSRRDALSGALLSSPQDSFPHISVVGGGGVASLRQGSVGKGTRRRWRRASDSPATCCSYRCGGRHSKQQCRTGLPALPVCSWAAVPSPSVSEMHGQAHSASFPLHCFLVTSPQLQAMTASGFVSRI